MKSFPWRWIIAIILVLSICCLAALAGYAIYMFLSPGSDSQGPVTYFSSPSNGEELPAGTLANVHIIARDSEKVTRVELWVDGSWVASEKSPIDEGVSPLVLSTGWVPAAAGEHTMRARAYDSKGVESIGEISIMVVEAAASLAPDRDGDRFPDDGDVCPDEAGDETNGCPPDIPDADSDGVADDLDECLDTPGSVLTEGCPDGDGDGVADEYDSCLDAAGAGDSPAGPGCPSAAADDRDGDGVNDADDACPDEPGAVDAAGCPGGSFAVPGGAEDWDAGFGMDRDGDGVGDSDDRCPDEAGLAEEAGCPAGTADRDGDGFPDSVDLCPDIAGEAPDGCAAPGGVDDDSGIFGFGFPFADTNTVEFQALSFTVNQDYNEVNCYASVTSDPPDLYGPFHFEGERSWNISESIGSTTVGVAEGATLPVNISCYGYSGPPGAPEFHFIGQYTAEHGEDDWDGHVITALVNAVDNPTGSATADTEGFTATYRICKDACENTPLPAPVLVRLYIRSNPILSWSWGGEATTIDGFKLYVNGTYAMMVDKNTNSLSVADFEPPCGGATMFRLSAVSGSQESPLSNFLIWNGASCDSRQVRVTFNRIVTHGGSDDTYGPIFGNFRASGSTDERLVFNGNDYPYGFSITADGVTSIMSLFNTINASSIHSMCSGGRCLEVSAPEVNYVEVEVERTGSLSVGASLYDENATRFVTLIDMDISIPFEDIAPGSYSIRVGNIEVVYFIDYSPAEEAASVIVERLPDLRITELEAGSGGQARAWVVNTGGPMTNQPLRLEFHDRDDGSLINGTTYDPITLAEGEGRWLQSGESVPIYGVTAVVDPDDRVDEGIETNNTYTAPVLLQVSLEKIYIITFCEFFLTRYSEFQYSYSVGYGPNTDHITWDTYHMRYPVSGYVRYDRFDNDEGLYVYPSAEEVDYNVHVAVPAGNNLYILMSSTEHDGGGLDDSMGSIFVTIPEAEYINANQLVSRHHSEGASNDTCHDAEPLQGGWLGFDAWFMVHRLE